MPLYQVPKTPVVLIEHLNRPEFKTGLIYKIKPYTVFKPSPKSVNRVEEVTTDFIAALAEKNSAFVNVDLGVLITYFYTIAGELEKYKPAKLGVELSPTHQSLLVVARNANGKNIQIETFFNTENGEVLSILNVFEHRKQLLSEQGSKERLFTLLAKIMHEDQVFSYTETKKNNYELSDRTATASYL